MENGLQELFLDELKDLYHAEHQVLKALPKMAKAASAPDLRKAFQTHLRQTETQIERLERIFKLMDMEPRSKRCKGMEGIIEEGKEALEEDFVPAVMDAALVASSQRVEHYEMAGYGTLRTFAEMLGHTEAAKLLQETLQEEEDTDKLLTVLAKSHINQQAAHPA